MVVYVIILSKVVDIMVNIPEDVKTIMKKVNDLGYEIYLIGGFVRDSIMQRTNKDYDLCTNMPFDEIKKIIPNFTVMRENDHRNTGVVRVNGVDIEITMLRGKNLYEDLLNRDFTINSIALAGDGNVVDLLNGKNDIDNKVISVSDKSGKGFETDPLRILRAIRFAAILGFEIDENTYSHMLDKKYLLNNVACERVLSELNKIIMCDNPGDIIRKYYDIFSVVIPELEDIRGVSQNNPYHVYDVFEHTMTSLNCSEKNLDLRYAIIFHDMGKKETKTADEEGIDHFYGHPKISTEKFINFARRMRMDNTSTERIKKLIFFHDVTLSEKSKGMNKFLQIFGVEDIELLFDIKLYDILGQNLEKADRIDALNHLKEMYVKYIKSSPVLHVRDLDISGRDLINMNFEGKIIGVILKDVLEQVSEENLNNSSEEIINYVNSKYR